MAALRSTGRFSFSRRQSRNRRRQTQARGQSMDFDLTGKLALVTGSTRGIGLASAKGLAGMGADVIVNGRERAAVDEAIAQIGKSAPKARLHAAAFNLGEARGCAGLI